MTIRSWPRLTMSQIALVIQKLCTLFCIPLVTLSADTGTTSCISQHSPFNAEGKVAVTLQCMSQRMPMYEIKLQTHWHLLKTPGVCSELTANRLIYVIIHCHRLPMAVRSARVTRTQLIRCYT